MLINKTQTTVWFQETDKLFNYWESNKLGDSFTVIEIAIVRVGKLSKLQKHLPNTEQKLAH